MTGQQFVEAVKAAYMKTFPKGYIDGRVSNAFKPSMYFEARLQGDISKVSNQIKQNDAAFQSWHVWDIGADAANGGELADKMTVEIGQGGSLMVQPAPGSHRAFDSVKFGWRKKSGNADQLVKHLANYFKKMKKVVDQNRGNLSPRHEVPAAWKGSGMDKQVKREVLATLIRAGRKDLARSLVSARTVVTAGYSHYWRPPGQPAFTDVQWKELLAGVKKIISMARKDKIDIAGPMGKGKPKLANDVIALNGREPDEFESFMMTRKLDDFQSCKTGERPYDAVVVSILALARKIAPELMNLSSDGGDGIFQNPPYKV